MGTDKDIYIHAGAHRTGTSSFQMCLSQNRAALKAAGFDAAFPGRDGIPGGTLALRLPGPRHGLGQQAQFAAKVQRTVQDASPDPTRALILSEENIPGRMMHFRKGQFFPASAARADALAQGLGSTVRHLVYVVRPYHQLFVSGYRKRAEDNPVEPFTHVAKAHMKIDRGWPEVMQDLQEHLRPEATTVLTYENRGSSVDLLRRLAPGLSDTPLDEPDRVMNLSATDAALEVLQTRYHAGEELNRRAWRKVLEDHKHLSEDRGFTAYAAADMEALQSRYDADLERLSEMKGITLVA